MNRVAERWPGAGMSALSVELLLMAPLLQPPGRHLLDLGVNVLRFSKTEVTAGPTGMRRNAGS